MCSNFGMCHFTQYEFLCSFVLANELGFPLVTQSLRQPFSELQFSNLTFCLSLWLASILNLFCNTNSPECKPLVFKFMFELAHFSAF